MDAKNTLSQTPTLSMDRTVKLGLFGSFRVSTHFDHTFFPGAIRASDLTTFILTSDSSNSCTSLAFLFRISFESSYSPVLVSQTLMVLETLGSSWFTIAIPVLRLETESLSRTFSSPRTATHPPLGQELSQRRFHQSRADCLLSSRPCWMVLGQGEQSIPIFPSLAVSLVNVLALPSPVSWAFHLIMSHAVALFFVLCVLVLPFSIGESICSF